MKYSKVEAESALEKLYDLKKTFEFGTRMVPIIQNISNFLKEVVPLLRNINYNIAESAAKMPVASDQIKNVTSQTELATNEILDLIDQSTESLSKIGFHIKQAKEKVKASEEDVAKLKELVKDNPEALEIVKRIENKYNLKETEDLISEKISDINDKNFQVTMSLQVQDITSQQLNAVQHLIVSVQEKLDTLIDQIDKTEVAKDFQVFKKEQFEAALPEGQDFNPNAKYEKDGQRQSLADEIIEEHKEQFSQDDIDKLFG